MENLEKKILLDHVWSLFANQEDSKSDEVVEAAFYFHLYHDFDIEELPEGIREEVQHKIRENLES